MKLWKYLLVAILIFSTLFQIAYGIMLMSRPETINITIDFGDLISNETLQILIFMYGRIFLSLAALSALTAMLVIKNSPYGIIFSLTWVIGMIFAGISSFTVTDDIAYLFADTARGLVIGTFLALYYFMYYRKNKKASPHKSSDNQQSSE